MKKLAVSMFLTLALVACGGGTTTPGPKSAPATLTLSGYGPHAGQKVEFKVTDLDASTSLKTSGTVATDGKLTLVIQNAVGASGRYNFDWYADLNGNGVYNAPPTDHAWRRAVNGNSSGATVNHDHDTNWTDIAPF